MWKICSQNIELQIKMKFYEFYLSEFNPDTKLVLIEAEKLEKPFSESLEEKKIGLKKVVNLSKDHCSTTEPLRLISLSTSECPGGCFTKILSRT